MQRLGLQTLVDRLNRLTAADISVPSVQQIVADGALDDAELRRYVGARPDRYARRLVHRGKLFDVMVLTWGPGQCTPIHNHAGNCGWVRLVRGQIAEETFRLVPGAAQPDAAVAPSVHGRIGNVGLEPVGRGVLSAVGSVATVDRVRAIHRIGNPAAAGSDTAVTLHVYSLPHDRCVAFDLASRTCEPRDMRFDDPLP